LGEGGEERKGEGMKRKLVAVSPDEPIVMVRSTRGWGMLLWVLGIVFILFGAAMLSSAVNDFQVGLLVSGIFIVIIGIVLCYGAHYRDRFRIMVNGSILSLVPHRGSRREIDISQIAALWVPKWYRLAGVRLLEEDGSTFVSLTTMSKGYSELVDYLLRNRPDLFVEPVEVISEGELSNTYGTARDGTAREEWLASSIPTGKGTDGERVGIIVSQEKIEASLKSSNRSVMIYAVEFFVFSLAMLALGIWFVCAWGSWLLFALMLVLALILAALGTFFLTFRKRKEENGRK
jgi:uncharacterized membrane protein